MIGTPLGWPKTLRSCWKTEVNYINNTLKTEERKEDYEKLLNITTNIMTEVLKNKKSYFDNLAEKLCGSKLDRKAYWSILKSFTNWKKVSIIPSLFLNDHFVTNFNKKVNHFNDFSANQCSLINNHRTTV